MNKTRISPSLRKRVSKQARYRCGYCLTPQRIIGMPMEIDHIIPESLGGSSQEGNLWLACRQGRSLLYYVGLILATGPMDFYANHVTICYIPKINPTYQSQILHAPVGRTVTGRATVKALRLNNEIIVDARRLWVQADWHPPKD